MIHVSNILDADLLVHHVGEGRVSARPHPTLPLVIYNYTQKTVVEDAWDHVTLATRGLILDEDFMVVARPFPKFFNLGERVDAPDVMKLGAPDTVSLKYDGSLGIVFNYEGSTEVATRGSFESEQAIWATEFAKRRGLSVPIDGYTRLCEIIYPSNRIVVDYDGLEDLTYLSSIHILSGADADHSYEWPFGISVDRFEMTVDEINEWVEGPDMEGEEGVVMTWHQDDAPAYRLKVKREDYVRLHRLVTGITARRIWDMLRNGEDPTTLLVDFAGEEWLSWVQGIIDRLSMEYQVILADALGRYLEIEEAVSSPVDGSTDRKVFALEAKKHGKLTPIIFMLLDDKDPSDKIWKMLRPEHETPYRIVED